MFPNKLERLSLGDQDTEQMRSAPQCIPMPISYISNWPSARTQIPGLINRFRSSPSLSRLPGSNAMQSRFFLTPPDICPFRGKGENFAPLAIVRPPGARAVPEPSYKEINIEAEGEKSWQNRKIAPEFLSDITRANIGGRSFPWFKAWARGYCTLLYSNGSVFDHEKRNNNPITS